ncbi:MAG: hypothetical protein JF616_14435 [Fibrobacteres bacterium]|nr:hypothetical protein [Fibrobacterota bacterium]
MSGEKPGGPSGNPATRFFVRIYREFPSAPDPADATTAAAGGGDEESGKFVILRRREEIHLVLSPVAFTPYHADIVRQYLQVEGRGRVEGASASGCRILSPEWTVHGGGHYVIQHWLHHLRLHGKSSGFGRYEAARLTPFLDGIPESLGLEGYTLELE